MAQFNFSTTVVIRLLKPVKTGLSRTRPSKPQYEQ